MNLYQSKHFIFPSPFAAKPVCDDMDDVEAVESDDHTFSIQCDGDPKPVCKWTKDGKPIEPSDRLSRDIDDCFHVS